MRAIWITGIVIKKNEKFYALNINVSNDRKQVITTELYEISAAKLAEFTRTRKSVSYNDIDGNYDFEKLQKQAFISNEKDDDNDKYYSIYKLE